MVAELEEIVAQCRDVHVRGDADGDLGREHVGAGLHRPVARAVQALDGDALAVEEIGQLEQDAGLVGRHHLEPTVAIEVADGTSARIAIAIPYKNIWLKSSAANFRATLEVTMKVTGPDGAEAWAFAQTYPLDIPQSRLKEVLDTDFKAEASAPLKPGAYSLSVTVVNTNDGSRAALERKFEI